LIYLRRCEVTGAGVMKDTAERRVFLLCHWWVSCSQTFHSYLSCSLTGLSSPVVNWHLVVMDVELSSLASLCISTR